MRTLPIALVLGLAVLGHHGVYCNEYGEEDEEGGYGGDMGEGGGYGGGDEEEGPPPPPPPSDTRELTSLADFDEFLDNDDASIIAGIEAKEIVDPKAVKPDGWDDDEDGEWAAPTIEHPALTTVHAIASSNYGYRFAFTSTPEVLEKLKCKKSGLFLYRSPKWISVKDGDRPRERFPSDDLKESAVSNWLAAKAQPLVGLYNYNTKERYKSAVLVIFMNTDKEKNGKSVEYVLKRARKKAAALKGKGLAIALGSLSELNYELSDFGLTSKSAASDILMGIKKGDAHYSGASFFEAAGTSAAFSGNTLAKFADAFLAGEIEPYVKPPPEDPPPSDDEDMPPPEDGDDAPYGEEGAEDKEEM